jgi:hypothetical protein
MQREWPENSTIVVAQGKETQKVEHLKRGRNATVWMNERR